jgi:hypothetical protein
MKTRLTVDTLLTTLEDLAAQADTAGAQHWGAGNTWEGEALQALARQIRHLVHAATTQLNP